jgi:hypothetical protein
MVLDLSAVTKADTRLLRAVVDIHLALEERGGSLALAAWAPAGVGPALHSATLAQAFSIRGHPSEAAAGPGSP